MRVLIAIVAIVASFAAAQAGSNVEGAEIVAYGIYTIADKSVTRGADGVLMHEGAGSKLAVSTTNIPLKKGVVFGIEFKIVGQPAGASVPIDAVFRYPPGQARPPGQSQPLEVSRNSGSYKIGDVPFVYYVFEEEWEMLPGPWAIELWYEGRKLAEQRFNAVEQQ